MNRNLRVQLALLVYLVFITGLLYMRPSNFYNKDGTLKQFKIMRRKLMFLWFCINF